MGNLASSTAREQRMSRRKNLLLSAIIVVSGLPVTVRIRNLSDSGALLEGNSVPSPGTELVLKRGLVEASATVVWSDGHRCGVRFDSPICLPDWTECSPPGLGLAGQARVDAVQTAIRNGSDIEDAIDEAMAASNAGAQAVHARVSEELAYVQRMLEAIGDELASEMLVVHRHAKSLQQFDRLGQILGHLATVLRAEDQSEAVMQIGMQELRDRLSRRRLI